MRWSVKDALAAGIQLPQDLVDASGSHGKRRPQCPLMVCPIEGSTPQEKLWRGVCVRWPRRAVWEYAEAVPGRRFRLDIAFPAERIAIEVDGFSHHGKYLSDFKRDRERQNLLTLAGWRVLRYYAGEIHEDLNRILDQIADLLVLSCHPQ